MSDAKEVLAYLKQRVVAFDAPENALRYACAWIDKNAADANAIGEEEANAALAAYCLLLGQVKMRTGNQNVARTEPTAQAVAAAITQKQPRLPVVLQVRRQRDKKRIGPFLERFREEYWGGHWLDDAGYERFMASPAACLFSRADFHSWGIPLASHASQLRVWQDWINDPPSPSETGVLPEGEPVIIDGEEHQTRFRMRLQVWEHLPQDWPDIPFTIQGYKSVSWDELFRRQEEEQGRTVQVETVKDRRDARCVERVPSATDLDGFPVLHPDVRKWRGNYKGAYFDAKEFPNVAQGRMERWVQWAYPGTCLYEFATAARELALEMDWTDAAACRALATGETLAPEGVVSSLRYLPSEVGTMLNAPREVDRIELSVDPNVSPEAVREAYRKMRSLAGVGHQYHTDTGPLVAAHVEEAKAQLGFVTPSPAQRKEIACTFARPDGTTMPTREFWQAYKRASNTKRKAAK